ncbi:MAG: nascent polypeptide-associated complex protein [Candidatus Nanoarchaeia archaeon]
MFPGMNMNSKQMQQAMKKMGVEQEDIEATKVIISMPEHDLVFSNPQVSQVNMMGQDTFQIVGDFDVVTREITPDITAEDIQTIIEQTGASKEESKEALEKSKGDLAQAIMMLHSSNEDIGDE